MHASWYDRRPIQTIGIYAKIQTRPPKQTAAKQPHLPHRHMVVVAAGATDYISSMFLSSAWRLQSRSAASSHNTPVWRRLPQHTRRHHTSRNRRLQRRRLVALLARRSRRRSAKNSTSGRFGDTLQLHSLQRQTPWECRAAVLTNCSTW